MMGSMDERHLKKLYRESLALLTDFYQMTMAYGYWKAGLDRKESVFHLFFRTLPFHGGYAIAAGLESVVEFLENFRFDDTDIAYLSTLKAPDGKPLFEEAFFDYLLSMKFSCDVDAVEEGTAVFPFEPMIRIKGPLVQCQLLESPLLNLFNFPTLIATKAARVCMAAKGDPVLEFGLRRAQGIDGALTASRAAYIGGCDSTSNVLAGKLFGIPVKGTHSHSWVMVFDDELESFQTFGKYMPSSCVFLVDTYNTIQGVEKAIEAGKTLRKNGHELVGIRLDSGDLAELSIKARSMLDAGGFPDALIVASNELDETIISELKRQGAKINVWGVGTNLVTGRVQPALDGVYKLSAIRDPGGLWKYKLKLSEQMRKVSNPGILQVRRFRDKGINIADAIFDVHSDMNREVSIVDPFDSTKETHIGKSKEFHDLLVPIFREGKRIYDLPPLESIREKTQEELSCFPVGVKRFLNPHQYTVGMERMLYDLKIKLVKNIRSQKGHDYIVPEKDFL